LSFAVGFGLSAKPLDGDYQSNFTMMQQADIFDALADHLGLKSVLVAHDMGQTVGLELLARFEEGRTPFRIRHAILLNGSTLVDMVQPSDFQKQTLAGPSTAIGSCSPQITVMGARPAGPTDPLPVVITTGSHFLQISI
jgi:pimeloyl-ACP methyl ester carboxylesterase